MTDTEPFLLGLQLKDRYLHDVVEQALPFRSSSRDKLNEASDRLLDLYAKCVTQGDKAKAKQQLKLHQRENIAWERDTVWRQMIAQERRGDVDGRPKAIGSTVSSGDEGEIVQVPTPAGRFKLTRRKLFKLLAVIVFIVLLNVKTVEGEQANRCFAILVFSTILWATEVMHSAIRPWRKNTSRLTNGRYVGCAIIRYLHGSADAAHLVPSHSF